MKFRKMMFVAACALLLGLLAACTSGDNGENAATPSPEPAAEYTPPDNGAVESEEPTEPYGPFIPEPDAPEPAPAPEWTRNYQRAVFRDGDVGMTRNYERVWLEAASFVRDGVMFVPVSALDEVLDGDIDWQSLDVEIITENGVSFASVAAVAEQTNGGYVAWDAPSNTAIVTTGVTIVPGGRSDAWHGTSEAIRHADNYLRGQRIDGSWGGTLDNDATIPELRFMIRTYQATGIDRFRNSMLRGINGIIDAQYANGGFPQQLNQPASYHGEITFNDGAMINVLTLWLDIVASPDAGRGIDEATMQRINDSLDLGIQMILTSQIRSSAFADGVERLTAWCAQHHRVTLEPVWARNFEPPSISSSEGVGIVQFLMRLPEPCEEIQAAIHAAVYFYEYVEIFGYREQRGVPARHPTWGDGTDRIIVEAPGSRGFWARFVCIDTFEPLFLDRNNPTMQTNPPETDYYTPVVLGFLPGLHNAEGGNRRVVRNEDGSKNLVESFAALSHERRNGYAYVGNWPGRLPNAYQQWLERNNLTPPNTP